MTKALDLWLLNNFFSKMHLHWERSHNTAGDCNIRSLSWMGRVPDEIPQEEGWKLNRNHYYQEGWLSTANLRGVVGVTYTTSHCAIDGSSQLVPPSRTNYNLRGHRAEVGQQQIQSSVFKALHLWDTLQKPLRQDMILLKTWPKALVHFVASHLIKSTIL